MLSNLHIENIAVIEKADVELSSGFNVLTGETGSGKSIIIDSINAILGKRTSRDIVRAGCSKGFVSALFTDISSEAASKLFELGFCDDPKDTDTVLLQRSVSSDGKSVFKINTRPATAAALKEIGTYLIDIHGQNDNQFLLVPSNYYRYLDKLASNQDLYNAFLQQYNLYKSLFKQRRNMLLSEEEKKNRIFYLNAIVDELSKAKIYVGEKDELTRRQTVISNSEKIISAINFSNSVISGNDDQQGILSNLSSVLSTLNDISKLNHEIKPMIERLNSVYFDLEENIDDINKLASNVYFDHNEAQQIDERLDLIYKLSKKYSVSPDDLPSLYESSKAELNNLIGSEKNLSEIEALLEENKNKTIDLAFKLSESRKIAAKEFENSVVNEMKYLDMPYAQFQVRFSTKSLDKIGLDDIDFYLSVNPGEELKPLSDTASGGELSRIMLSIKNVLSKFDFVETMIFDEIDSGTSGKAAAKIGNKLKAISNDKQVICITHLAQIAALADSHLLVKKHVIEDRTSTNVILLNDNERCEEIARIMGGESITENTLSAAREMLGISVDN